MYQVAGYLMKGITLFISPLLALASDQLRKLRKVTSTRPDFVSLHLDDMQLSSIKNVARDLSNMKASPTSECRAISVILFASPQLLTGSKGETIMELLLDKDKSTLHMVVMDEVHLAAQLGSTFRNEFKLLKRRLYSPLPDCCSINAFMTGTCTLDIMRTLESLFGISINLTHWPNHEEMRHRSVGIMLKYIDLGYNLFERAKF